MDAVKETKQQPGTAGPANILGCCLVSLRFLCDIHSVFVSATPISALERRRQPSFAETAIGCSGVKVRAAAEGGEAAAGPE